MHYQLYFPGQRGQSPAILESAGLGDFAMVSGVNWFEDAAGPDGKGGAFAAWPRPGAAKMGFLPDQQEWLPAIGAGEDGPAYWIGFWKDADPTPEDLLRAYPEPGEKIALGDGREWLVPTLERIDKDLIRADDGTWRYEIQRRYYKLWLDSLDWARKFQGANGAGVSFDMGELAEFVERCLRINYRLLPEVTNRLRLFTQNTIVKPFGAILGMQFDFGPSDPGGD